MANGVKKIAIFAIMGAFLLFSLAGCGKAAAAKGSSSSSSSSKATASSAKKSSSIKSSSKSSSSTTKSSVVASSSSVAASSSSAAPAPSSSVSASSSSTPSSSVVSGMDITQIAQGNFSSIVGEWSNGATLDITDNTITWRSESTAIIWQIKGLTAWSSSTASNPVTVINHGSWLELDVDTYGDGLAFYPTGSISQVIIPLPNGSPMSKG